MNNEIFTKLNIFFNCSTDKAPIRARKADVVDFLICLKNVLIKNKKFNKSESFIVLLSISL